MTEEKSSAVEKRLSDIYRTGRIAHAYILEGNAAVTLEAAVHFAEKLVSTPADILYPEHEKPKLFSVEDVRSQIQASVYIRPYGEARKVYIFRDADLMNVQAQNALLKTIEEPPEYAVMILLAENAGVFLETVLSRCVVLSEEDAGGTLSEGDSGLSEKTLALLRKRGLTPEEILAFSGESAGEKLYLGLITETVRRWFRDILILKCGGSREQLIFEKDGPLLSALAERVSFRAADKVLSALDEAEDRLDANVSPEPVIQMLLCEVSEAYRKQK